MIVAMNSVIYSLFISLAIRMTVVTGFVFLIKLIFRHKLSAKTHCLMWIVLLMQTVFCIGDVNIPSKASIYNYVPQTEFISTSETVADIAVPDLRNIIALIYAVGVGAMFVWNIGVFLVYRKKTLSLGKVDDPATLDVLKDAKERLGISDNILLRSGEYAQTLMRTVILPDGYSCDEQRQILLHELCHYKNKDNIKLWTAVAVLCFNWFNPFVWLAFMRYRSDIEMYCDENVMKVTDSRKEYARVLVKTASERSKFIPGAAGVSNGRHEVSRRVRVIVAWKKKRRVWFIAAVMACMSVSCLCLTDAVSVAVETNVDIALTPPPIDIVADIINTPVPTIAAATEIPDNTVQTDDEDTKAVKREQITDQTDIPVEYSYVPSDDHNVDYEPEVKADNEIDSKAEEIQTESPAVEPEMTEAPAPLPSEDHTQLGEPDSVSANGSKETYSLDDGRTAVLHYDGDDLEMGYIISDDHQEHIQEDVPEE